MIRLVCADRRFFQNPEMINKKRAEKEKREKGARAGAQGRTRLKKKRGEASSFVHVQYKQYDKICFFNNNMHGYFSGSCFWRYIRFVFFCRVPQTTKPRNEKTSHRAEQKTRLRRGEDENVKCCRENNQKLVLLHRGGTTINPILARDTGCMYMHEWECTLLLLRYMRHTLLVRQTH